MEELKSRNGRAVRVALMIAFAGAALGHAATAAAEVRSYDGTGNNLSNLTWGSTFTHLARQSAPAYADGFSSPSGASRPNPRAVSQAVLSQTGNVFNERNLSDMFWQWGQFIDHDMDLTDAMNPAEPMPISIPAGDPWLDPFNTGAMSIPFSRSRYDIATGTTDARQQENELTSFLDASMVYGSDGTRASWLRTGADGKLKVSSHASGDLLPFGDGGSPGMAFGPMGGSAEDFFVAGDVRANEQSGLAAMHTLFVREHNRLADAFADAGLGLSDEEIYQRARRIVGAEVQIITYKEWLPAFFGGDTLDPYTGYDDGVDPSIMNEFSTAAFRVGHTMLSNELLRLDENGNTISEGNLGLFDAFFRPDRITDEGGIEPLLRGLAFGRAQEIDAKVIDSVRNQLFGPPGSGGMDLTALNIQRGRDHGLDGYNAVRTAFGLPAAASFADITSDTAVQTALASVYGSVDDVDPWVGMIAEDHLPGSSAGLTITTILTDQFTRLRDGDRFYFENDAELASILSEIGLTLEDLCDYSLSDILLANTSIESIQGNIFFTVPTPGAGAIVGLAGVLAARRRRRGA